MKQAVIVALIILGVLASFRYFVSVAKWQQRGCGGASLVQPMINGDPDWWQWCESPWEGS